MTVKIDLPPEKEAAFKLHAQAHGLTVEEWLLKLGEQAARESTVPQEEFDNLELLLHSPFAGANLNLQRPQDDTRPAEIE
jgi:hypothetical protein